MLGIPRGPVHVPVHGGPIYLVTTWDEVAGFFGGHDVPSTLVGVAVLGYPGQLVEIEAIAVTPAR